MFTIWKKWMKINHVSISDEPMKYLKEKSREFKLSILRGGYNYRLDVVF